MKYSATTFYLNVASSGFCDCAIYNLITKNVGSLKRELSPFHPPLNVNNLQAMQTHMTVFSSNSRTDLSHL